ncbi:MAG: NUDIX domain-containing protein [Deltaproteobacteria bacterium]|nr:NUDIX domain-containing protein [Deltaproteobacteria bacterium]
MKTMNAVNDSYIGQIRVQYGSDTLIAPGVRIIIRDHAGKILLVKRTATNKWEIPAGSVETDESILEAARHEVFDITGLSVGQLKPFAYYSDPVYQLECEGGEKVQQYIMAFITEDYSGELLKSTEGISDMGFYFLNNLPEIADAHIETIHDLFRYQGAIILK